MEAVRAADRLPGSTPDNPRLAFIVRIQKIKNGGGPSRGRPGPPGGLGGMPGMEAANSFLTFRRHGIEEALHHAAAAPSQGAADWGGARDVEGGRRRSPSPSKQGKARRRGALGAASWALLVPSCVLQAATLCLLARKRELLDLAAAAAAARGAGEDAAVADYGDELDRVFGLQPGLAMGDGGGGQGGGGGNLWLDMAQGPGGPRPDQLLEAFEAPRPEPGKARGQLPALVTHVDRETVEDLAVLVGSLHFWHPEMRVLVYVRGELDAQHLSRVRVWRGVRTWAAAAALEHALGDEGLRGVEGYSGIDRGKVQLGEAPVSEWEALLLHHALSVEEMVLYVAPWMHLKGWFDVVARALYRDGSFLLCASKAGRHCIQGTQGYRRGGEEVPRLREQVVCALNPDCEFGKAGGGPGGRGSWFFQDAFWEAKPPEVCHDPERAQLALTSGVLLHDPEMENSTCVGERPGEAAEYKCRLIYNMTGAAPDVALELGGADGAEEKEAKASIGVGLWTSSYGFSPANLDSLPILSQFAPAFAKSLLANNYKFVYTLYIGFKAGDAVFDSDEARKALGRSLLEEIKGHQVRVKFVRVPSGVSKIAVWNGVHRVASADRNDYFMAVQDSTLFTETQFRGFGWADVMVESLQNSLWKDFGVASPLDPGEKNLIAFPFVHRSHFDVFGTFYPATLGEPESLHWISRVYGFKSTYLHSGIQMRNSHLAHNQTEECTRNDEVLEDALREGAKQIKVRHAAAAPRGCGD